MQEPKRSVRASLILGLVFLISSRLNGQTIPLEKRIFILSKAYASIGTYFAHWEDSKIKPEKLDEVYQEFLKRAIGIEARRDFDLLMLEFIALFNNSHTRYWDDILNKGAKPLGFSWVVLNGQWVVTSTSIDGLKRGSVISKINGKPVDSVYSEYSKYMNASGERARLNAAPYWLPLFVPDSFLLEFIDQKGKINALKVDRTKLALPSERRKTEGDWIEKNKIAYIKIPSFGEPRFENDALELVKRYKKARALIIDVRGNTGGSTPSHLIQALMDRPYRWYEESTPMILAGFREDFYDSHFLRRFDYKKPENTIFSGKLIILIDRMTGSAAEDFIVSFKDNGRATLMGEKTQGSTGQPYIYDFGDGIKIFVGAKRAYMPDGSRFEGVGIAPDIEIKLERTDLGEGKDKILDTALEVSRK
jgi:carboxyl-terminal processing protease